MSLNKLEIGKDYGEMKENYEEKCNKK